LSKPLICKVSDTISIEVLSTLTEIVLPALPSPVPAVTLPAPENCVNVNVSVPRVAEPVTFERTKPASALVEPSSIKVNSPPVTSALESASSALVNTAAAEPLPTVLTK